MDKTAHHIQGTFNSWMKWFSSRETSSLPKIKCLQTQGKFSSPMFYSSQHHRSCCLKQKTALLFYFVFIFYFIFSFFVCVLYSRFALPVINIPDSPRSFWQKSYILVWTVFDLTLNVSFMVVWARLLGLQFREEKLKNRSLCGWHMHDYMHRLCFFLYA